MKLPPPMYYAAGNRPRDTASNLGIFLVDTRNNDITRHSDIMKQVYRLLEYSHLVTDIQ